MIKTMDKAPNTSGETCPVCGDGPFNRLNQHISMKHGDGADTGTSAPPKSRSKGRKSVGLTSELKDLIDTIGAGVTLAVNPVDGMIIMNGSEQLATALSAVAAKNPAFKEWLDRAMKGSVYGGLGIAVLGIVYPILTNHGMVPALPMFPVPEMPDDPAELFANVPAN